MGYSRFGWVFGATLGLIATAGAWAQTNQPAVALEDAWARHVIQNYQDLQQQQQAALRAIENARLDSEAAARRNAEAMEARLKQIEEVVTTQRERELATIQGSHHTTLVVVSIFAGVGFCGMLLFALALLRSLNRRASAAMAVPVGMPLGPGYAAGALGAGDTSLAVTDPARQSTTRFLGAVERLEQRIRELETSTDLSPAPAAADARTTAAEPAGTVPAADADDRVGSRVALLLGKGQALLNLQQADSALVCFDEVIAADPTNAEAFVKKGGALEKLGRLDEAIDCYDRAIALDTSMTMAYLCKGGVFNRLERHGEALQCYEQALRAQQKPGVA